MRGIYGTTRDTRFFRIGIYGYRLFDCRLKLSVFWLHVYICILQKIKTHQCMKKQLDFILT